MNFDSLRKFCATLPGATMDIKWGADECHCVAAKMFAVFCVDGGKARTMSFKCDPERFLELTDVPGIVPAPYLARAHWVQVQEAEGAARSPRRARSSRGRTRSISAKLTRRQRDAIATARKPQ